MATLTENTNIMKIYKWLFGKKKEQEILKTSEVFKTLGVPKYTFIERKILEEQLNDVLNTKDKALLFLGYSKSGKTVYRQKFLENNGYNVVTFRCNNNSKISDLYDYIASQLKLGQLKSTSSNSGNKQTCSSSSSIGQKDFATISDSQTDEISYSFIETKEHVTTKVDVNFLCSNINEKEKLIIVLEDYHLTAGSFNKILSEDLKHFQDEGILFLLIGIPSLPNRALKNNPDLSGRLKHLNFDYLQKEEVKQIIKSGCEKLNCTFSEDVVDKIIEASLKNAFLVQSICKEVLLTTGLLCTSNKKVNIVDVAIVENACKKVACELNNDYSGLYEQVSSGARKQQENKAFNQYEEILKAIQSFDISKLEKGVSYTEISNWSWTHMPAETIQKFVDNGTYQSEATFKGALTHQILQAVERINANLTKTSSRQVLYVDDKKVYLTDLMFKFYLNWK
jgi:hypothetical protein